MADISSHGITASVCPGFITAYDNDFHDMTQRNVGRNVFGMGIWWAQHSQQYLEIVRFDEAGWSLLSPGV